MFDLVKRRGDDYSLHRYCLDFVYTLTLRSRYAAIRNTHDIERAQRNYPLGCTSRWGHLPQVIASGVTWSNVAP
ncbi:MAG: hypothetical protein ACK4SA_24395, partial [Caldilinea sp.]